MSLLSAIRDDFRFYRTITPRRVFLVTLLDRSFWICANYRLGFWASRLRVPVFGSLFRLLYLLSNFFVSAVTGTDIRTGAVIGKRPNFHTTFGIMIADGVVIGDDCVFTCGVGVVNKANGKGEGQPRIGKHVTFGTGCKVVGAVEIGDHVIIGANAVVLQDVPSYCIAVGVPAVVKPISSLPFRVENEEFNVQLRP